MISWIMSCSHFSSESFDVHTKIVNDLSLADLSGTSLSEFRVTTDVSNEIVNASSISSFYYKLVKTDLSFAIIGKH